MIPPLPAVDPDETQAILSAALHEVRGGEARLMGWTADSRFTENGKRRVVRYDLEVRLAGISLAYQWLGKFYDNDVDPRRVASVLRNLGDADIRARDGLAVPTVLAYHAPRRLLLLTYESGEPVISAIARDTNAVLAAIGRALAALHAIPVAPEGVTSPEGVLEDLRPRVQSLCARFPDGAASLRSALDQLERDAPSLPPALSFVHGDFGPANLLWRRGQIVVLDFDKCGRGDPALDIGNFLTQLLRITVRKPDKLRDFASARACFLDAYRGVSPPDPSLDTRIAWYERAVLLRKIYRLAFNTTGDQEAEARRQRQDETDKLLRLISSNATEQAHVRFPGADRRSGIGSSSALSRERESPLTARPDGFPVDPDFPQLTTASDPRLMIDVFRTHLKPVAGKTFHIEECVPFRFRCRQAIPRCVLQYTLRISEPSTGRRRDLWVTGILYAEEGEAERLWKESKAQDPGQEIPEEWRTFEPVSFIPELGMLVEVFPFDQILRNLRLVVGDSAQSIDSPLLARLGPGEWRDEERTIEPTRYRTELVAALRYTIRARDAPSERSEDLRCYLKVYRKDRGAKVFQLLNSLSQRGEDGERPYSVVKPVVYLSELRTLVLEEAPGVSLTQLLVSDPDPTDELRRVARAVAAFNQDDLAIESRESLADQLDEVQRASALVQWACPEPRTAVDAISASVMEGLEAVPGAPIHGDLKPDHIFLSGSRVSLIDLDTALTGDPVRDPAHLSAYILGRIGLDSIPIARAETAAATFVEEYWRHVPQPWRRQFPLHLAGALLEVASGIFRRQEPRWPEMIATVIGAAPHAISGAVR